MKQTQTPQLDRVGAKKLIRNIHKIKNNPNYDGVRLIKDKNKNIYVLTYSEHSGLILIYDALTLEYCGRVITKITEEDNKKQAEIIQIRLVDEKQNKKIGTQVMQFAEHMLKSQGVEEISLLASKSRASTKTSILEHWYKKLGYEQTTHFKHIPDTFVKSTLKYAPAKYDTVKSIVPCRVQNQLTGKRFLLKPTKRADSYYNRMLEQTLD